jgi:hypothetical protein
LLCGNHTEAEIDRNLRNCSHLHLLNQIKQDIPLTLRQQRRLGLHSASPDKVPKPGNLTGSKGS